MKGMCSNDAHLKEITEIDALVSKSVQTGTVSNNNVPAKAPLDLVPVCSI